MIQVTLVTKQGSPNRCMRTCTSNYLSRLHKPFHFSVCAHTQTSPFLYAFDRFLTQDIFPVFVQLSPFSLSDPWF